MLYICFVIIRGHIKTLGIKTCKALLSASYHLTGLLILVHNAMSNLIKISKSEGGKDIVSARELYSFLGVTERFNNWMDRQLQYGFIERVDYVGCKVFNTLANQLVDDYALTIDCAKEISMLQRSEKGKQARLYFIECEKKLKSSALALPQTFSEALRLAADQAEKIEAQQKQITEMQPKAIFADSVTASCDSILIGELARFIKQKGFDIGQNRLFEWMRSNGYLCSRGELKNQPSQKAMELGLFEVEKVPYINNEGVTLINVVTKVTGKGQMYFVNKFLGKLSEVA